MNVMKNIKKVMAIGMGAVMLGATVTGALALNTDLAKYPAPFVTDGQYDNSNVIVVGANAAASDTLGSVDIATSLVYDSRDCTNKTTGDLIIRGGKMEEVDLGESLASAFDSELDKNDIDTLLDSSVNVNGDDYDYKELVKLQGTGGKGITLQTSLTSSDDDYQSDVAMEFDRDSLEYLYSFDDAINVGCAVSDDNPMEIKFLGKTVRIVSAGDNSITAYVGTEYFMNVDDSVQVDGKKITLKNVGSQDAIVVDVDGVSETISGSNSKTINGIEIVNQETFYDDNKADRSATLVIGKDARQKYSDGDAYVGEDKDDPNWVWDLQNLNYGKDSNDDCKVGKSTDIDATNPADRGPVIGIRNDFVYNDESDNPPMVGDCVDMPNNYISVCLDQLTVSDSDYSNYDFKFDSNMDLSKGADGINYGDDVNGIVISAKNDEGFKMAGSGKKTDEIYLTGNTYTPNKVNIFFKNSDNKIELFGNFSSAQLLTGVNIANVNYQDTKNLALTLSGVYVNLTGTGNLSLSLNNPDASPANSDNLVMDVHTNNGGFTHFGVDDTEDATDLVWNGTNIGTKDNSLRTQYGIIIKDPSSTLSDDEVSLNIPGDQVKGDVSVRGNAASVDKKLGQICTAADITPATKLDTEIAGSEQNYNVILVGGPCANHAVERIGMGYTCAGWSLKDGEGVIKLAQNGQKVAMLIAGTQSIDTRRTAKAIASYKDYKLTGQEMLVKGTTLNDITVVGPSSSQTPIGNQTA